MLGLKRRTIGSENRVAIKTSFNALVRPILEYACRVERIWLNKYLHNKSSVVLLD